MLHTHGRMIPRNVNGGTLIALAILTKSAAAAADLQCGHDQFCKADVVTSLLQEDLSLLRKSVQQAARNDAASASLQSIVSTAGAFGTSPSSLPDVHNQTDSRRSEKRDNNRFCVDGRLFPSLYLLGAQKAGTTSLALDLMKAGVASNAQESRMEPHAVHCSHASGAAATATALGESEFMYEKAKDFWGSRLGADTEYEVAKKEWLDSLPLCDGSSSTSSRVLASFETNQLAITPLPNDTVASGFHYGKPYPHLSNASLPRIISEIYGELGRNLTFVIMLREPIGRMQSTWYHAASLGQAEGSTLSPFDKVCADCKAQSFQEALAAAANAKLSDAFYQDWLWRSAYAKQLGEWLRYFEPRQFLVVPLQLYSERGFAGIRAELSSQISFECPFANKTTDDITALNSNHHPNLEDDVSSNLLQKVQDLVFKTENEDLVNMLTREHSNGLQLAGFSGQGSKAQISEWLYNNW